jgi:hypothetical protein
MSLVPLEKAHEIVPCELGYATAAHGESRRASHVSTPQVSFEVQYRGQPGHEPFWKYGTSAISPDSNAACRRASSRRVPKMLLQHMLAVIPLKLREYSHCSLDFAVVDRLELSYSLLKQQLPSVLCSSCNSIRNYDTIVI